MPSHEDPFDSRRDAVPGDESEWITISTAPDQLTAEMWQQLMWQESIPAVLDPHDTISFMGVTSTPVRLKVPADLATKALEVLAGVQGSADWVEPNGTDGTEGAQEN